MKTVTLFRWEQDGAGGDHGTLTLWPDTPRELRLVVQDFRTAHALEKAIRDAENAAYEAGFERLKRHIQKVTPWTS